MNIIQMRCLLRQTDFDSRDVSRPAHGSGRSKPSPRIVELYWRRDIYVRKEYLLNVYISALRNRSPAAGRLSPYLSHQPCGSALPHFNLLQLKSTRMSCSIS